MPKGFGDLDQDQDVALVAAAGAAGGHFAEGPKENGLGDASRGRELVQGGTPLFVSGVCAALGVLAVLVDVEGFGRFAECGDGWGLPVQSGRPRCPT